jgi:hypothetical protein
MAVVSGGNAFHRVWLELAKNPRSVIRIRLDCGRTWRITFFTNPSDGITAIASEGGAHHTPTGVTKLFATYAPVCKNAKNEMFRDINALVFADATRSGTRSATQPGNRIATPGI